MGQIMHTLANFNQWSSDLPVYLQVFLGMMTFFLTCSMAGFLVYGLLLLSQRMRALSSLRVLWVMLLPCVWVGCCTSLSL